MAQEFFIKSTDLEDKIRQLLPSQGGLGAGFDLSASTQIVPIVDLTESAEGSNLREDLQSAISFNSATEFDVSNASTTVISTTGYWRIFGGAAFDAGSNAGVALTANFVINDGASDKLINSMSLVGKADGSIFGSFFDFIIKLEAGHTFRISSANADCKIRGSVRQLAALDGTLINP
jgi:hypothetical protein